MRILIVEDDTSLVRGLKKALATAGFAVDHEINGAEAIEIAPSEAYSLIVLDLGLPGLPGQEVLQQAAQQRLRGANPHPHGTGRSEGQGQVPQPWGR